MKRTYTDQEMMRILKQELVVPDKVDKGMQEAYRKLGIEPKGKISFIRKRRIWHVVAVAAVMAVGSSVVVFAANKFLSANLVKEKDAVTYDLAVDQKQEAHEVKAEPTYMPEGYELGGDNSPYGGKWHNEETGGTVSFRIMNAAELDEQIRLGNVDDLTSGMKEKNLVEEIEINGMKVALFMRDSDYVDSEHNALNAILFNEEDGYMIEIFNSQLPKDEVVKIAKGLDIQVLDSTVPYQTDAVIDALLAEQKASQAEARDSMKPKLLSDDNFFSTGEELKLPFTEADGIMADDIRYTVESIEIKDSLPASEYPAENYQDYDGEIKDWLNEDGTLKPHERYKYTYDESGKEIEEPTVETVNSKFVVAHMKLKNCESAGGDASEVMVCPLIDYLSVGKNGISKSYAASYEYRRANENYHLETDGFPVYFDKMQNTDGIRRIKDFHIISIEPGDELEYTLAYVVDEDQLDNAFFQFYSSYENVTTADGENKYVYVKVKEQD